MVRKLKDPVASIKGGLVVSCQAEPGEPLDDPQIMAAFAKSAELGGARGIRARGAPNIRAIRQAVDLPIIGIEKTKYPNGDVLITEDLESGKSLAAAGCDIIAVDATSRPRPDGTGSIEVLRRIKDLGLPVMADISSLDEALEAEAAGADLLATTLVGYYPYDPDALAGPPDFDLLARLTAAVKVPVVAEGRYRSPEEAVRALETGAWAVVIGEAITKPIITTRRFVTAMDRMTEDR